MDTSSRSEPQTRRFICQSLGVWSWKPKFDSKNDNATPINSTKTALQSDLSAEELGIAPETTQECSREIFCQTKELCDVTDTYPYMEPDGKPARSHWTILRPTLAVLNTVYVIIQKLNAMTITDIDSCAALVCSTERVRRRSRRSSNAHLTKTWHYKNLFIFRSGYSLRLNRTHCKTRPLMLKSVISLPLIGWIYFTISLPFFFFLTIWLVIIYTSISNQYNKQGSSTKKKRGETANIT